MYSNSLSQKAGDIIERDFATLCEDDNVVEATRLMNSKNTSCIIVRLKNSEEPIGIVTDRDIIARDNGKISILGVLTLMSIVGESSNQSISLADIDISDSIIASKNIAIVCPYCGSKFDNKTDLSKHIDRIHIGSGLLEGDTTRW